MWPHNTKAVEYTAGTRFSSLSEYMAAGSGQLGLLRGVAKIFSFLTSHQTQQTAASSTQGRQNCRLQGVDRCAVLTSANTTCKDSHGCSKQAHPGQARVKWQGSGRKQA